MGVLGHVADNTILPPALRCLLHVNCALEMFILSNPTSPAACSNCAYGRGLQWTTLCCAARGLGFRVVECALWMTRCVECRVLRFWLWVLECRVNRLFLFDKTSCDLNISSC